MNYLKRVHNVYIVEGCGNDFARLGSIESRKLSLYKISGTVSSEEFIREFSQYDAPSQTSFEDTLLWTGAWLGLFYDEKSRQGIFSTDYFGFGQIFYTIIRNKETSTLIVADSFRGVVEQKKEFTAKLDINWDVALPHLISNTNLFSTRCSQRTFAEDINILHDNEALVFDEYGISIIDKHKFINSNAHDYNYWLDKGIERATNIINSAEKTGRVNELSLSGGKDSRALLGLILNSDNKNVTAYTASPLGVAPGASREILEKDFILACKLTERFDIEWNTNTDFIEYRVDFNEALDIWQNLRGNLSFDLRPKYSQVIQKNEVRFTGIGGELFRSYIGVGYIDGFPNWWRNAGKTKSSIRDDLTSLFKVLCPSAYIDPNLYNRALFNFVNSMDFGYGDDVIAQLDINYRKYRSRCHSSVHSTHGSEGALLSYPLCLPEFVIASTKLSREEQEGGKTLFDIIERTCPDLNALEYASPPWPKNYVTRGNASTWSKVSGDKQSMRYREMVAARTKKVKNRGVMTRDFKLSAYDRLVKNMDKLRNYCELDGFTFFEGISQRVARAYQKNDQSLYSLVSKTETLLDILQPIGIEVACSSINISKSPFKINTTDSIFNKNKRGDKGKSGITLSNFVDICDSIDMSDFEFSARLNDSKKVITVDMLNKAESCQVACYLYKDGVKFDQIWYTYDDSILFNVPDYDSKATYRVTVFFKWEGETHAQKVESFTMP